MRKAPLFLISRRPQQEVPHIAEGKEGKNRRLGAGGGEMVLGPIPLKECAVSRDIIKKNRNILIRQSFPILLHHLVVPWYSRGPKQWVTVHSMCSELCSTYGIYIAET